MVPKCKKNIHACQYHFDKMLTSKNVEEYEINFAAFVNSARNITFVLQKEFSKDEKFKNWYEKKQDEMKHDELCIFFHNLRNEIVKEGVNRLDFSTTIEVFNSKTDIIDRPKNSMLQISGKGIYYLVNQGTAEEDLIPAKVKGKIITNIFINNPPISHLGKLISNKNILNLIEGYFKYLKDTVNEWTGIINHN